jgi:hypothetical protein
VRGDDGLGEDDGGTGGVPLTQAAPGPVEQGVDPRVGEVGGVGHRGPQEHEGGLVRHRRRDGPQPALGDPSGKCRQRGVDEFDGEVGQQGPVLCPARQGSRAGQISALGQDGRGPAVQVLCLLSRHRPGQRLGPQFVCAVAAVVQHPDERDPPGEVVEGDRPAGDLGDLGGTGGVQRGQGGQLLAL